jgi:hypothetical protein
MPATKNVIGCACKAAIYRKRLGFALLKVLEDALHVEVAMKRFITGMLAVGLVYSALVIAGGLVPIIGFTLAATPIAASPSDAPDNNPDVLAADRALVAALAKSDKAAAGKLFDAGFSWTNSAGDTIERAKVLESLPKPPLGDESGAQSNERTYGQVGAVQVASGKVHVLRIWVKRPAGWRLLDYHEVTQRSGAAPPPGPGTNDCQNPCKGVPYTPKNDAEKGILKSWGELETAVTNHDPKGWSPHFLDEFVLISSGGSDPITKAGRLEMLSKPGIGPAPPQLAASPEVRFVHFGDTVVMMAQANPYSGKPAHISRIWVYRDGLWRMTLSYQTTIQSAAPIVPPNS